MTDCKNKLPANWFVFLALLRKIRRDADEEIQGSKRPLERSLHFKVAVSRSKEDISTGIIGVEL